jgi:hypothetical protein
MDEEMRPDKSHVVIEKFSDDVVIAMIEPGYDHILPKLNEPLSIYTDNGISVVASNGLGLMAQGANPVDVRNSVIDSAREMGVI